MKMKTLNATTLRLILSVSLFLIVALGIGLFAYAHAQLHTVAVDVSHTLVDADASQNNLQTLQKIQRELASDKAIMARASSIVADSQSYQYQDQIITDLKAYAAQAGVGITNLDFTAGAPATGATASKTAPATATPTPNGVKSTSVAVTLNNPVDYNNLLAFIHSIEQNLTKMQISKVSLSKGENGNEVNSDVLTIEVYIK